MQQPSESRAEARARRRARIDALLSNRDTGVKMKADMTGADCASADRTDAAQERRRAREKRRAELARLKGGTQTEIQKAQSPSGDKLLGNENTDTKGGLATDLIVHAQTFPQLDAKPAGEQNDPAHAGTASVSPDRPADNLKSTSPTLRIADSRMQSERFRQLSARLRQGASVTKLASGNALRALSTDSVNEASPRAMRKARIKQALQKPRQVHSDKPQELLSSLPSDWVQRTDPRTNRIFYANIRTQTTTWKDPRQQRRIPLAHDREDPDNVDWLALPPEWYIAKSSDGEPYYINESLRKTSWFHPRQSEHDDQLVELKELCRHRSAELESLATRAQGDKPGETASNAVKSEGSASETNLTRAWLLVRAVEQLHKEMMVVPTDPNAQVEQSRMLARELDALGQVYQTAVSALMARISSLASLAKLPISRISNFHRNLHYLSWPLHTLKTDCELKLDLLLLQHELLPRCEVMLTHVTKLKPEGSVLEVNDADKIEVLSSDLILGMSQNPGFNGKARALLGLPADYQILKQP